MICIKLIAQFAGTIRTLRRFARTEVTAYEHVSMVFQPSLPNPHVSTDAVCSSDTLGAKKARQSAKIREIADALVSSGHHTLDEQANALGLGRSTAWAVLKNGYKNSGMSAAVVERVLSSQHLPPPVRTKVNEYVAEKVEGLYGHSREQRRRFCALLSVRLAEHGDVEEGALNRRLAAR
ncbi:MAG: hypothetical protein P8Y71_00350 [Pseudolabrys sp.]